MTTEEKLIKIAENEQKVYEKGCTYGTDKLKTEIDNVYDIIEYNGGTPLTDHRPQAVLDTAQSHWNEFTENGARTNYDSAFRKWKSKYIYPKATIKPTSAEIMFYGNENIVELPDMDFSDVTDNSEDGGCKSTFSQCRNLKKIGTIKIPYAGTRSMFNGSEKLREIKKLIVTEDTYFHFTFDACYALEEIRFEGTIGNPNGVTNGGLSFPYLLSVISRKRDKCIDVFKRLFGNGRGVSVFGEVSFGYVGTCRRIRKSTDGRNVERIRNGQGLEHLIAITNTTSATFCNPKRKDGKNQWHMKQLKMR